MGRRRPRHRRPRPRRLARASRQELPLPRSPRRLARASSQGNRRGRRQSIYRRPHSPRASSPSGAEGRSGVGEARGAVGVRGARGGERGREAVGGRGPGKAGRGARGAAHLLSAVEDVHDLLLEQQPLVDAVVVVHEVPVVLRVVVVDDAAVPQAIVFPVDAQPTPDDGLFCGLMHLHVQQAPGIDGDQDRLAQRWGGAPLPHASQDRVDHLLGEPPMTAQGKGAAMVSDAAAEGGQGGSEVTNTTRPGRPHPQRHGFRPSCAEPPELLGGMCLS